MGDFRTALVGMLAGYAAEVASLQSAARAQEADVAAAAARKLAARRRALPPPRVVFVRPAVEGP